MEKLLLRLSNRAKYILEILDDIIDLRRKTTLQVCEILTLRGYSQIEGDFKYLTKMPMDSVTIENVDAILKEQKNTEQELEKLKTTHVSKIWLDELTLLEIEYSLYKTYRENIQNSVEKKEKRKLFIIKKPTAKPEPQDK